MRGVKANEISTMAQGFGYKIKRMVGYGKRYGVGDGSKHMALLFFA